MIAKRATFGSRYIARRLYRDALAKHGDEYHPAVRAARGRWIAVLGEEPPATQQRIEGVAWERERGLRGHWNRRMRRYYTERFHSRMTAILAVQEAA